MIKLKKLVKEILAERGMSMGYGSMSSNDLALRPMPGKMNDPEWEGITEGGKGEYFVYCEGNDWEKHRAGISVYITEGDKPYKLWVKVKTNGLRKKNHTNEAHKEQVRKHIKKIAGKWMSESKRIHNNPELNEVGNPTVKTWQETFKNALESIKPFISEYGETEIDPINFTYRK